MSPEPVVSNASPLIALEQIGHLPLARDLFGEVVIPPAVRREIAASVVVPAWVVERALTQPIGPRILAASLGPGESETLSLALELDARAAIIDEWPARRLARLLGVPVVGTLGLLVEAKRRGILASVRPHVEALLRFGFRVSAAVCDEVLRDAGEG